MLDLRFIKNKRTEKGIDLQYMSEQLGFKNASTYKKYEDGIYKMKAEMLPTLAKVLECEVSDFFK